MDPDPRKNSDIRVRSDPLRIRCHLCWKCTWQNIVPTSLNKALLLYRVDKRIFGVAHPGVLDIPARSISQRQCKDISATYPLKYDRPRINSRKNPCITRGYIIDYYNDIYLANEKLSMIRGSWLAYMPKFIVGQGRINDGQQYFAFS